MIIPIRTDYRRRHTPWVNYVLVAINVALFVMGLNATTEQAMQRISPWMLYPDEPGLEQFFSCMFLHANFMHLLGNMIFLWVFGNAVNDKLGHAGYLAFYLAGGVLAGIGYLLLAGHAPVLGASGAIAAVAGAYLVLLPRTNITVIVWLFYLILPFEVSSLYFLMIQFVFEIFMTLYGFAGPASGGVAYAAHASGYLFGILVAALLLALRLLPRDGHDLLYMLRMRYRRARYERMASSGYDPFRRAGLRAGRKISVRTLNRQKAPTTSSRELELRKRISNALRARDVPQAAALYLELDGAVDRPVLSLQAQLDVANQLMASQQYAPAAEAYERFVQSYPQYEHIGDIYLMLGLLYGRYLQKDEQAEKYLNRALGRLTAEDNRRLAEQVLADIRGRRA